MFIVFRTYCGHKGYELFKNIFCLADESTVWRNMESYMYDFKTGMSFEIVEGQLLRAFGTLRDVFKIDI